MISIGESSYRYHDVIQIAQRPQSLCQKDNNNWKFFHDSYFNLFVGFLRNSHGFLSLCPQLE